MHDILTHFSGRDWELHSDVRLLWFAGSNMQQMCHPFEAKKVNCEGVRVRLLCMCDI